MKRLVLACLFLFFCVVIPNLHGQVVAGYQDYVQITTPANPSSTCLNGGPCGRLYITSGGSFGCLLPSGASCLPAGTGTVTSIATTSPITGGTITTTGTIACATCVTAASSLTLNQLVFGAGSQATAVGDLTGDATTSGGKAVTVKAINGTALSGLATGILKNTTTTGVPSIAVSADVISLFTGCSGSQYLGADGACHSAAGAGTVTSVIIAGTANQITVTGTCTITTSGTCTLSVPSGFILPGTINGLTITTTTGTLTITGAKVLTVSNSLTLAGTDGVTLTFPATSATIARTDAAQTFTGIQTFSTPIALSSLASTVVNASSPGVGIAHFAGSTQTVTSSAVSLTADVTGLLPNANMANSAVTVNASGCLGNAGSISLGTTGTVTSANCEDKTAANTLTNVAAPASPSVGLNSVFSDSTDLRFHDKNASGVIGTTSVAITCTNQVMTVLSVAGAFTCSTITSAFTSGTFTATAHNLLSATHGDTTASSAVRGGAIFAVGASPLWTQVAHSSTSGGYWKWNGTDVVASTGAASGIGSCTNQAVTAENADAAPTCSTIVSTMTDTSIAHTGVDINTSYQVTATHLAAGLPIAQGGTAATSSAAGTIPYATSSSAASWSATPTLGASGTAGTLAFGNATSGTVTLGTVTGALGSVTASLPANTGTIAETNLAETFSALQTHSAGMNLSGASSPLQVGGSAGSNGNCFLSAGAGATPTWGSCGAGGGAALSGITAATGSNTIANGNNSGQVWNWALTTNTVNAMTFGETTAATSGTGTAQVLLNVATLAGSTAVPLAVSNSLTGSQTIPALRVAPTWNTSGVAGALSIAVTNTASNAASTLISAGTVAAGVLFSVSRAGVILQNSQISCSTGLTTDSSGNINGCVASDQRLKKNIVVAKDAALPIIAKLVSKEYEWADPSNRDRAHHYGFVAQDVRKVFPAGTVNAGGPKGATNIGIDAMAMSSLLAKGEQELFARESSLQMQIDVLRAEVKRLDKK